MTELAARFIVFRILDDIGQTRWMMRVPTTELPANADAAHPLKLTVTEEWDNNIALLPEQHRISVDLTPWGNPFV